VWERSLIATTVQTSQFVVKQRLIGVRDASHNRGFCAKRGNAKKKCVHDARTKQVEIGPRNLVRSTRGVLWSAELRAESRGKGSRKRDRARARQFFVSRFRTFALSRLKKSGELIADGFPGGYPVSLDDSVRFDVFFIDLSLVTCVPAAFFAALIAAC
jgi:hypothetical protein